jgi:hypothetical protein
MPHLLDSANAKLDRAEETANELMREIDVFIQQNPSPYRIVGHLRNDREYVFTAFGELVIPLRFAVLFGEVVYQLRTALDHLLSALVIANGGTPSVKHQFPICSRPEIFVEAKKRGDISGVSTSAEKLIERTQPYQPRQPTPPLLNLLREWNNTDKHRLLVMVGGAVALGDSITFEESDSDFSVTGMTPPLVRKVTNDGRDIFTIDLGESHARFRACGEFVSVVAVEGVGTLECASVHEVLTKMVAYVRDLFATFAAELP